MCAPLEIRFMSSLPFSNSCSSGYRILGRAAGWGMMLGLVVQISPPLQRGAAAGELSISPLNSHHLAGGCVASIQTRGCRLALHRVSFPPRRLLSLGTNSLCGLRAWGWLQCVCVCCACRSCNRLSHGPIPQSTAVALRELYRELCDCDEDKVSNPPTTLTGSGLITAGSCKGLSVVSTRPHVRCHD